MADVSLQGMGDMMSYIRTDYPSSIVKAQNLKNKEPGAVTFDDVMSAGFGAAMNAFPVGQNEDLARATDLISKISVNTPVNRTQTTVEDNARTLQQKTTESTLQDAVTDAGQAMIKKTTEVLNVSEEEVTNAMEHLGMSPADLLNPENLRTLTMELTGTTDETELLTNDALFQDLQQLMDTASELTTALLEQFDLSEEQLTTAIENLSAGLNMDLIQTAFINPEMIANTPVNARVEATDTAPRVAVDVEEEGDMVMQEEELMQENAQNNLRTAEGETKDNRGNTGNRNGAGTPTERIEYTNVMDEVAQNLTQNVSEVYAEAASQVAGTGTEALTQAEDILRQMTEFIRVEATPDTRTMELALHPQSLGHVIVQVSEGVDGNMTARFLTQNETVRQALELQMAELQQRFDEQGLKVTEISVTVESHAFEQNLQQGAGDPNSQGQAENAPQQSRIRRINLDDDAFDVEGVDEMSEAERIAADMMARSGNRLDYMA
ncbi:MAG: flagellar hook-length control protein FliK [Lachnospiraceae bacterium]|nr:flagellar hook-length control protein FliK [Lachnospiraceae bacterium]